MQVRNIMVTMVHTILTTHFDNVSLRSLRCGHTLWVAGLNSGGYLNEENSQFMIIRCTLSSTREFHAQRMKCSVAPLYGVTLTSFPTEFLNDGGICIVQSHSVI